MISAKTGRMAYLPEAHSMSCSGTTARHRSHARTGARIVTSGWASSNSLRRSSGSSWPGRTGVGVGRSLLHRLPVRPDLRVGDALPTVLDPADLRIMQPGEPRERPPREARFAAQLTQASAERLFRLLNVFAGHSAVVSARTGRVLVVRDGQRP